MRIVGFKPIEESLRKIPGIDNEKLCHSIAKELHKFKRELEEGFNRIQNSNTEIEKITNSELQQIIYHSNTIVLNINDDDFKIRFSFHIDIKDLIKHGENYIVPIKW
jgi:hypothetical protein